MVCPEVGCRGCEYIGNRAAGKRHRSCLSGLSCRNAPAITQPPCRAIAQYITDRRVYFATSLHAKGTSSHVSIHHRLHSQLRHIALVQPSSTADAVGIVPLRELAVDQLSFARHVQTRLL
jgi:hypothetical protein